MTRHNSYMYCCDLHIVISNHSMNERTVKQSVDRTYRYKRDAVGVHSAAPFVFYDLSVGRQLDNNAAG